MTEEPKPVTADQPQATAKVATDPGVAVSGSTITAFVFAVPMFLLIAGSGVLNILAATGGWNPFHWRGRLWTGVFMLAASSARVGMAALAFRIRSKMTESAAGITFILMWIAVFWAVCGGPRGLACATCV